MISPGSIRNLGLAFLLWYRLKWPIWLAFLAWLFLYATSGGYRYLYVVLRTIKRDATLGIRYLQVLLSTRKCQRNNWTVPHLFHQNVQKHPDKICYIFEDKKWTFKEVEELSNRVAHVFDQAGLKRGDAVSLLLDNRPEYVSIWLGLAQLGVVTALVNHNQRDKPLAHCIRIVDSKAVIYGADFSDGVKDQIDPSIKLYGLDFGKKKSATPPGTVDLDSLLDKASSGPLSGPQRSQFGDKMLYIYTSGTTGLPKAAVIKHSRFLFAANGGFYACGLDLSDTVYVALPMYHMTGGVMGIGMALIHGCTTVIRRKFSASNFWTDCIKYDCTTAIYIGEICRYLLAAPPRPEDRSHKIRLLFGSGLRPQIWEEFIKRFQIKKISEFYGSTEGNANIMNFDGKVGAVGFITQIAPSIYPVALIKVSEETGEPVRGPDGLCIRCGPWEPGMFVSKVKKDHPISDFPGYVDAAASKKKLAKDVFSPGDAAYLSGDLLVMDELGYLFFKDRTGDTFRWRGENVSTAEVEAVISNILGLKDCGVYGVEVPGNEGRAGMAAIADPDKTVDVDLLAKELGKVLPSYARPLFLRMVNAVDLTGTYKLKKAQYQQDGFDLAKVGSDPVYFFDAIKSKSYVPFTNGMQQELMTGKMRL